MGRNCATKLPEKLSDENLGAFSEIRISRNSEGKFNNVFD